MNFNLVKKLDPCEIELGVPCPDLAMKDGGHTYCPIGGDCDNRGWIPEEYREPPLVF